ncbi:M48 family metallopeptidase [Rheinheimera sp. WS51]|uniref:M48 family metallopeptidase n=1 Tax=Rheinheimera sp. WS51 TaxID=3425886 RepID=UPI003D8CE737
MSGLLLQAGAFDYELYYSKRRSLAIQIKSGKVIVRAPLSLTQCEIEALLQNKQRWILEKLQLSAAQTSPNWLEQKRLPLFEQRLQLEVQRAKHSQIRRQQDKLVLSISSRVKPERVHLMQQKLVTDWYKQEALSWFTVRVQHWQALINVKSNSIIIGCWSSKWGYCRSDGRLGFNWRLLMAPSWVADYVVVHEVCHLKHMNHSTDFWSLVAAYCEHVSAAKQWLKQHQHKLTL